MSFRLLHTSDWHLGQQLHHWSRQEEHRAFLNWLAKTLDAEQVDALIVAGDIFDTTTPGNRATEQYFSFLGRIRETGCCHVVIVAGNHDSPTHLDAPAALLKQLNVHVIGSAAEDPADEVVELRSADGVTELIVAAVPYLRDQDLRLSTAGETIATKDQQLVEGIRRHYQQAADAAVQRRLQCEQSVPLIATGHLFVVGQRTAGGKSPSVAAGAIDEVAGKIGDPPVESKPSEVIGDGVRDLYVGTLGQVGCDLIPDTFSYVALGHLHVANAVGGNDHIRYSGSPIPMGFSEATHQKCVVRADFSQQTLTSITEIPIPVFQQLMRLEGDWSELSASLTELVGVATSIWLEVVYTGDDVLPDLESRIQALTAGSAVTVLKTVNRQVMAAALSADIAAESLQELTPEDVFERFLESAEISDSQRCDLRQIHDEILAGLNQQDSNAERNDEAA
ncbi:MAG: exonuclease SbcCD subunit D C-terminal domain-containing protein [Planctomycetaceae bacterium]|nr:exonuclease SbcCD subunit D C-terminal domain-containing protein [Planctomycetaceae bacterium]